MDAAMKDDFCFYCRKMMNYACHMDSDMRRCHNAEDFICDRCEAFAPEQNLIPDPRMANLTDAILCNACIAELAEAAA
jgi:hypothetical protein